MLADGKLAYALNSGAWALAGVVGTLLVCYLLGRQDRVKGRGDGGRFRAPTQGTMTLVAAVCIPLIGIAFTVAAQSRQANVNDCQTRINGQNAQALIARSTANVQDAQLQIQADAVIDDLIATIARDLASGNTSQLAQDVERAKELRAGIADQRAELAKQRAANPYADPISSCQ